MKGLVSWFARNPVAANLLMVVIIGGGILSISQITTEVFPEISSDIITISVVYPGAAPEEVEEGICIRIEEKIRDLEDIKELRSSASEGVGTVSVELKAGVDAREALDDIKSRVDTIDTFPDEAEQPLIQELILRRQVITVAVSGDSDERTLRRLGERVRDDLANLPEISQVELTAVRPYEISIEVSERALRRYGLTFDEVASAVRRSSLDLPGGAIKTEAGEILLRTKGQAYRGYEFERLVLRSRADGTRLLLGDVASVDDGFADTDQAARFDGQPAALVQVFRVGDQNATTIADAVKAYVASARDGMPEGIALTVWQDDTIVLRSRLDTLVRNGRAGLLLVFLVLALFLRFKLAGWVALGIPLSFLGAVWLMPSLGVTVNLISLFAFLVVLGIVVDDAIVVGENIYSHYQRGSHGVKASIDGALEVATPVTFSILTSVAAFAPLLMVPGNTGQIMRVIPLIVIATLLFSLIESLLVLPAHLRHLSNGDSAGSGVGSLWRRFQDRFARGLEWLAHNSYGPSLAFALRWRGLVLAIALVALLITGSLVGAGWIRFTFFPPVEADYVASMLTLPQGTPAEVTARSVRRIEAAAIELREELEAEGQPGVFRHVLGSIGQQPFAQAQSRHGGSNGSEFSAAHLGEVIVELAPSEEREITSAELARRWREKVGAVPDAVELSYTSSIFSTGAPIYVQLKGPSIEELSIVASKLKQELRQYPGVQDIADSFRAGKRELKLDLTPEGRAYGLTLVDLARQVRQAFYGEEAQRIQRGRDEIKVMVRYPQAQRRSLGDLEDMRVRVPGGGELPFSVAARVVPGRGYASIERVDRNRVVDVTADVDVEKANANEILADLEARVLPGVLRDHPQVRYAFEGEQQEQRETMGGLKRGFVLALMIIYVLLAIPFKSYIQPVIVMMAIPFGLIGAVGGHVLMGMDLTMLSMFGIVALTGVVVNDSLVMVDFINRRYREGMPVTQAIREAGIKRFRPIVLTSLTTFVGLLPLLLERSVQAQFLIPMAVSLAFGVLFATFITLVFVPVSYSLVEEARQRLHTLVGHEPEPPELALDESGS